MRFTNILLRAWPIILPRTRRYSTAHSCLLLLDLKPAVLSAAAALAFVWDPTPYLVNSSGTGADVGVPNRTANQSQELFLQAWAEQQFSGLKTEKDGSQNSSSGDDTLQRIVQLWRGYFELPWVARGQSDEMLGGSIGGIASSLAADLAHAATSADDPAHIPADPQLQHEG